MAETSRSPIQRELFKKWEDKEIAQKQAELYLPYPYEAVPEPQEPEPMPEHNCIYASDAAPYIRLLRDHISYLTKLLATSEELNVKLLDQLRQAGARKTHVAEPAQRKGESGDRRRAKADALAKDVGLEEST